MWSPNLVPKPKDWPDYVDISGVFPDEHVNTKSSTNSISSSTYQSRSASNEHGQSNNKIPNLDGIDMKFKDSLEIKSSIENMSLPDALSFKPDPELSVFLSSGSKPIFIGFGSMVIEDPESLVRDFLDAAALVGVRVIIQIGWSKLTVDKFKQLAQDAERKAILVKEMEEGNNQSVIFASPKRKKRDDRHHEDPNMTTIKGKGNVSVVSRDKLDDLLASVSQPSETQNNIQSIAKLESKEESIRIKDTQLNYIETEADIGDEDYVTISADDNFYDRCDDEYDANMSSSNIPAIPLFGRNIAGQVSGWIAANLNFKKTESRSDMTKDNLPIESNLPFKDSTEELSNPTKNLTVKESLLGDERIVLSDGESTPERQSQGNIPGSNIGWDDLVEFDGWKGSSDALLIGPCPHNWLFNQVAAVIHHGGAGKK